MSIEDEKHQVEQLRYVENLTLQEIAHRLGKSIYWVNSRLNERYEPHRKRLTASDEEEPPDDEPQDGSTVSQEVEKIQRLREEGLTYEQIAAQLNRSVYWVHSRLRPQYRPREARSEKRFQGERVVPYLLSLGHVLIAQYARSESDSYPQEADVITAFHGSRCITEVKISIMHHELQTAIGQLIVHRYAYRGADPLVL